MDGKRLNGDLVRMLRQSLRLKQVEFAARIGISQVMVSYIENGQRKISETTEGKIRREFNISDSSVSYLNAAHHAATNCR
ncbi:MAG: helix-turn-helix domain-containing protein [Bacillota bacterium]